jgi:hypothetical protein
MGKIIKLNKSLIKENKVYAEPNKHYRHAPIKLLLYAERYEVCLKLLLIHGDYPTMHEIMEMPVYQGRKYIKELFAIYENQASKRNKALTGKTLEQERGERISEFMSEWLKDILN